MYAKRSARVVLRASRPGLGVPVPLLRLPLPLLAKLVAVLTREMEGESGGDVQALPRLGLGLVNGSSFDDSWMTGNFFEGRRCTGRQGPHGERRPRENVVAVLWSCLQVSVSRNSVGGSESRLKRI